MRLAIIHVPSCLGGSGVEIETSGAMIAGSLANDADFIVGGGPDQEGLAVDLDFLRVARGTLAWQFDGPQLRDFAGNEPTGKRRDAGAIERQTP